MKKLLSILGSLAVITSGAATTMTVNKNVQIKESKANDTSMYIRENWNVSAEGPRTTIEKIGGVWRLEFNHELTQDIISGVANTNDILDIVSPIIDKIPELGEKIGPISEIINAVLKLGNQVLDKADIGNGILIRFGGWVLPTKVTSSNHEWN